MRRDVMVYLGGNMSN